MNLTQAERDRVIARLETSVERAKETGKTSLIQYVADPTNLIEAMHCSLFLYDLSTDALRHNNIGLAAQLGFAATHLQSLVAEKYIEVEEAVTE